MPAEKPSATVKLDIVIPLLDTIAEAVPVPPVALTVTVCDPAGSKIVPPRFQFATAGILAELIASTLLVPPPSSVLPFTLIDISVDEKRELVATELTIPPSVEMVT